MITKDRAIQPKRQVNPKLMFYSSNRLQLHEGGRRVAAEHLVLSDRNMCVLVSPHLYHFPIVHMVTRGQCHLVVLLLALHFLLHNRDIYDSCRGQGCTHSDGPGGDTQIAA